MRIGFILSLIFAVLISVFALQNSSSVNINFLFTNAEISQALVIFLSAIAGAIIVAVLSFIREFKLKLKIRTQSKNLNQLEQQINNLKTEIESLNRLKDEARVDDDLLEKLNEPTLNDL